MRFGLALCWTLLILIACSLPGNSLPSLSLFEYDKAIHFLLFAGFGWLWMQAFPAKWGWILLAGLLYAAGTEFYQGLLPFKRYPDLFDFIANALGLCAATGGFLLWKRKQITKK